MPNTFILGLSCFYHDSAACLVRDGSIIAAAQEERFTRKKHDPGFPVQAVAYCLKEGKISIHDVDYIVYYDKPFLTFERLLMSYLSVAPKGVRSWIQSMPIWLGKKLHIPKLIRQTLGYEGDVLFTEHHEAHAASAFFPSPFDSAAILTVDGVGEWATSSYGVGSGRTLDLMKELHFPNSLGLLYSAFTYFTGFKVNSGEYKLMGLAPYGVPRYKNLILSELIDLKEDGSLELNLSYFDFLGGLKMTNRKFARLFGGAPRPPESEITNREMDIAASIQSVTEEALLRMTRHVHKETGLKQLCMAGGVALNCVANGKILRQGPFDDIWIQPAAGDAGGALGAALSVWYSFLGKGRLLHDSPDGQKGSYLGPAYSGQDIRKFLTEMQYPFHELQESSRADQIAGLIAEGKIVGYLSGRMEFGPRALGARSILGDPRQGDTQEVMNLKIKYRESFRPFAPSVLEEKAHIYFDTNIPSPYMLLVSYIKPDKRLRQKDAQHLSMLDRLKVKRSPVPAVTHIDYSARLQTVNRESKSDYYDVINEFQKQTGCPVVVNTSFNVRGEPIVNTPIDAYRCFMRTEMDVLVMEDVILYKEEQPTWDEKGGWLDEFELD